MKFDQIPESIRYLLV